MLIVEPIFSVQMSDHEEEEEDCASAAAAGGGAAAVGVSTAPRNGAGLARNTNFDDVVRADKERREQAKQDAKGKKDKDKEDR